MTDQPQPPFGGDEEGAEQAEVKVETLSLSIEFDALNLSVEDIGAVQQAVLNELVSRAAEAQQSAETLAQPELRLPIPIPIPGGGFSKHSKTHSKSRGLAESEERHSKAAPHSKAYSKSHSKHTKVIIG